MKILIATDIPINFICGSTNFIKRLAILLQKKGHQVLFMCPGDSTHSQCYKTPEGLSVCGIRSLPALLRKNLRLSPPITIKKFIQKTIQDFRPDVIHTQSHFLLPYVVLKVARQLGIATVGTNHFMPENIFYHFHLPAQLESAIKKIGWKHLHTIYKHLDLVTTPTETAANLLRRSGFPKPVEAVSNGIDLERFHPGQVTTALRKKYALTQAPVILFVGRLDPEKNVENLIQALPIILKKTDVQLVIVGCGAREKFLRELAAKLKVQKKVIFTGFVLDEDLPRLYCLADCFAVPGTAELQSIATMEAMASALPIVAADAVALPELVHSGENGYLHPPGDVKVLAERLTEILINKKLKSQMAKRSLEIIQAHDINKMVKKFESIYKEAQSAHKNS